MCFPYSLAAPLLGRGSGSVCLLLQELEHARRLRNGLFRDVQGRNPVNPPPAVVHFRPTVSGAAGDASSIFWSTSSFRDMRTALSFSSNLFTLLAMILLTTPALSISFLSSALGDAA